VRVAVTGASGLLGSALVPALRGDGHAVVRFVRRPARGPDEVEWDPAGHRLDPTALSGVDAVVNLSGAGIGDRRWSAGYKRTLVDSRVGSTATLARALARAEPQPAALLSASAVGWYGDTGDRTVDERDPPGEGFLAELCRRWEEATRPAAEAGARVVHLRTGPVLAPCGGLLGPMLPLFRLGLGGRLGSGRQYWPWISLADWVRAVVHLLGDSAVTGPVNVTGPEPVTNAEFARALARLLRRPALARVPGPALRLVVGEFATEGILAGQRAVPRVLAGRGFAFTHPTVDAALRYALARAS
jgi:uncharacterized protein